MARRMRQDRGVGEFFLRGGGRGALRAFAPDISPLAWRGRGDIGSADVSAVLTDDFLRWRIVRAVRGFF